MQWRVEAGIQACCCSVCMDTRPKRTREEAARKRRPRNR